MKDSISIQVRKGGMVLWGSKVLHCVDRDPKYQVMLTLISVISPY